MEKPALKSVVILANKTTLAIAVTICGHLPFTQAEQGLIRLPLIIIIRRLYEGLKLYYDRFSLRNGPGIFLNSANNRES